TITITLDEPQAGELVVSLADREGAIVAPSQVAAAPDQIDVAPIGAGPYLAREIKDGQKVTLTKNPDFFDPGAWPAGSVEFIHAVDSATVVNGLLGGLLDIGTISPTDAARL